MADSFAVRPLIELDHVSKRFVKRLDLAGKIARRLGAPVREQTVMAADDVSFSVAEGEVVGLVGESGCGKTTVGRMVAGILAPSAGRVLYRGSSVHERRGGEARQAALKVQMIFQDPFASLNPRMRMGEIVGEAPCFHGIVPRAALDDYVDDILRRVGLDPEMKARYPHEFSGGQRQRIGIARALAVQPEFIVCDEAVAALDVSIQAQIINLFLDLREELRLTYLFITHDIGVVRHVSDRIVVMYLGRVVETGTTADVLASPEHPYTRILLAQVPALTSRRTRFQPIRGEIPSPLSPPPGCHFHPRCPSAVARCREEVPALAPRGPGRACACHLGNR